MPRPRPALLAPLLVAAMLPAHGCCSLARAWCGPDETPWFDSGFETPEQSVRTVLEALRREKLDVVFDAMTPRLKTGLGMPTQVEQHVFRARLDEMAPYLFMTGYADPGEASYPHGDYARFSFEVEGYPVTLGFVRVPVRRLWMESPLDPDGVPYQDEPFKWLDFLPGSTFASEFTTEGGLQLDEPLPFAGMEGADFEPAQVLRLEYRFEWMLDELQVPQ